MRFGVHLPLIGFDERPFTLERLSAVTTAATETGYTALAANDHLLFPRPWLDGLAALSAMVPASGSLQLMTTVALPVVRGPVALAKALAAIDVLSGGRLVAAVGAGSSPADYASVGVPFEERWKRLDEATAAMRAFFRGDQSFRGRFYTSEGADLEPRPPRPGGPPLWLGSWGSEAGLRRVARLGDGWLASAYNTTPADFAAGRQRLDDILERAGRRRGDLPNGLSTGFMFLAESEREAERVLTAVVAPVIARPLDQLRERLFIGTPQQLAEKVARYRDAGLDLLLLWPVLDEADQVRAFADEVIPVLSE